MLRDAPTHTLTTFELVALVAGLSALNAFSIDIMLPALPDIGREFGLNNQNDRQLIVIFYVVALGAGQLFCGPLSDTVGRRGVLIGALLLYLVGTLLCVIAPSFGTLLAARALQGLGASATRVISTAVVRDLTSGRRMAQIMSMAMSVFMIVPIIAPSLGQLILFVAPWHWIFGALLLYATLILVWLIVRLPETLSPEQRTPFRVVALAGNVAAVLSNRQTMGYIVAATIMSAGVFAYVSSAQQIYVDVFGLGAVFPIAFAAVAVALTVGSVINARLVMRLGMRRISQVMLVWLCVFAALNAGLAAAGLGSFWVFIVLFALSFGTLGMINGNFNALAMDPAGHMAGTAAALFGAATAVGGALIGGLIGHTFNGSTTPFLIGFMLIGVLTFATVAWTERGRLFTSEPTQP